ncbi:MAG: DNA-processing protein DprA [Lachnospiraceae bacterium]
MKFEYWLASIRKLSVHKKRQLRKMYKSAEELYYIEETELDKILFLTDQDRKRIIDSKRNWNLEEYDRLLEKNITLVLYQDSAYPEKLKNISAPPYALYICGQLPDPKRFAVGIVGARVCSHYGQAMAKEIAGQLAAVDVDIISGLAKGIDGAAGRGALDAGGRTYAVLGSGVDVCYPREHIGLYTEVREKGGIISEQPPGSAPLPVYFPARNRIISGLSDVVIVIEAKEKSGSLITADMAMEQGKDVYALPGPVTSALSTGCNALIKQGAGIFLSVEDFIEDVKLIYERNVKIPTKNKIKLESTENLVYSCLDLFPKSLSVILQETKLSITVLMNILVTLELRGYIEEISKNYYVKKR